MIATSLNNFLTENVFVIESKDEFNQCFREKDQKKLILPMGLKFPLAVRSYFTWSEPSGVYTYLVFKKPNWDLPRGAVFKKVAQHGEPVGGLCSWCNSYGSSEDIGMFSVAVNANTSFSYILCQGFRCVEKIEETAALSGKNPEKNFHSLYHRIESFFSDVANYKQD